MIEIKVIKTEEDYREALKLVEELMARDPEPESEEGEKLALLATLVGDYESKNFPSNLPNPVEAIKFRMEQAGLKSADLIPYVGTRSRVSEILSGKRGLTLDMIRALETGLGIPAEALLKKPEGDPASPYSGWSATLVRDMYDRGYFGRKTFNLNNAAKFLEDFFGRVSLPTQVLGMLRQSNYRSSPNTDKNALTAWAARVYEKAKKVRAPKYVEGSVTLQFMQEIAKLSVKENSPLLVQEALRKHGIILVIEQYFPKTRLDGATLLIDKGNPIIGLTLRHDRLDNFWFTLMHELAHIALHYKDEVNFFYDELDEIKGQDIGAKEREADAFAGEALVPTSKWEVSPARLIPSTMAANSLAKEIGVHIAIVAGKIRHEGAGYVYLNDVVGEAKVKHYFAPEYKTK